MVSEWTILAAWVNDRGSLKWYKCQCSCGFIDNFVNVSNLKHGNSTRCDACAKKKSAKTLTKTLYEGPIPYSHLWKEFGKENITILKDRWKGARKRNKLCAEWQNNFERFLAYVFTIEGSLDKKLIMDRKDTFKGYEEGNIRFVTLEQNSRNNRRKVLIEIKGIKYELQEIIEKYFGQNHKAYHFAYSRIREKANGNQILWYLRHYKCWTKKSFYGKVKEWNKTVSA